MVYIYQKAQPFFLQGSSDLALLFIHGYTASPSEVYPTARLVHELTDCSVSGILLPGHGSHPRYLQETDWNEWASAVEQHTAYLLKNYKRVFAAGLSMGGLLSLYAGIHIKGLQGVVSINAPIFNHYPLLTALAPVIQMIKPYFPKKSSSPSGRLQAQGRFAYDCNPVKAFRSMLKLRDVVVREISALEVPLLIVQSERDESVHPRSARFLAEKTCNSAIVSLANSFHVATMGEEKEILAAAIAEFICGKTPSAASSPQGADPIRC